MQLEKMIVLPGGRQVLMIITGAWADDYSSWQTDIQVLVKDVKEMDFHDVIHPLHPKYYKIKQMQPAKAKAMQLRYSGLSAKHIRKALLEFEQLFADQLLLSENN